MPEWDLADRLTKALREAKMSVNEMALHLGVHRNTVSAWVNGRTPISGPAIRAWAARTNVDYDWIVTGNPARPPSGGGGGLAINGHSNLLLPRVDSNHQPSDERVAA